MFRKGLHDHYKNTQKTKPSYWKEQNKVKICSTSPLINKSCQPDISLYIYIDTCKAHFSWNPCNDHLVKMKVQFLKKFLLQILTPECGFLLAAGTLCLESTLLSEWSALFSLCLLGAFAAAERDPGKWQWCPIAIEPSTWSCSLLPL